MGVSGGGGWGIFEGNGCLFLKSAEMALPWNSSGIYNSTAGSRLKLW